MYTYCSYRDHAIEIKISYLFLWRFLRRRFLRLWVAILCRFLFFPLGINLGLYVLFNAVEESLGRLKRGNVVGRNFDRRVLRNVAARFLRAGFDDETAKASQINVLAGNHVVFDDIHESFYSS